MKTDRKGFLNLSLAFSALGLTGASSSPTLSAAPAQSAAPDTLRDSTPIADLHKTFSSPVKTQSIDVARVGKELYVRTVSTDGAVGLVAANDRIPVLLSLFKSLIVPFFMGKDARDLEALVDGVYVHDSYYKYAGMAFWNCVSHVELSLLDMLGKMANKPAGALLGKVIRSEIPVYVSRATRETTAEEEVEQVAKSLAETGANATKLKIGGRMKNSPRDAERTNRLIPLARKKLGDDVVIYVDSNGSYDAAEAIRVGRMLEEHNVGFYEEPCGWQEYEQTKRVADALTITVAGGEQDTSLAQFDYMIRHRVVDLVQPDVCYNGGLIRCLRVARMADKVGMKITPHSPKTGAEAVPMLHFASIVPNLGPHQEYGAAGEIKNGRVKVPVGPGLGILMDPGDLRKAEVL